VKIFISWSGARSKSVALALYEWLPQVIQSIDPWMSDKDIEKGAWWSDELQQALDKAEFGLVCVTPENKESAWLNFEGGALSNKLTQARACPYLFDIESAELTGPFARLQHATATKEETEKLLQTINKYCPNPMKDDALRKSFERCWGEFKTKLKAVPPTSTRPTPVRDVSDYLKEILEIVRELQRTRAPAAIPVLRGGGIRPNGAEHLYGGTERLSHDVSGFR
jgi:hypothetical protein